jgi:RsiW-degrading membrane proteinase PrsW (M82 family)
MNTTFHAQPTGVVMNRVVIQPDPPSPTPKSLVLAKYSSPWKIIRRMSAISIITAFIAQTLVMIPFGIAMLEPVVSVVGITCGFPLLGLLIWVKRPKLVEVVLAYPSEYGSSMHALSGQRTLQTPTRTILRRHIVRDSGAFDIPQPKKLWVVFSLTIATAVFLMFTTVAAGVTENDTIFVMNILTIAILAIPLLLLGFSIPVFAWWSYSSQRLGLPTKGHEAEAALTAGMLSTIPAICINSILFPLLLVAAGLTTDWTSAGLEQTNLATFLTLAVSAPVGEELCKAGAVIFMARYIDSPRRGFQIGFTVGLGFAIVENLMYVASSFAGGGLLGFAMTTFVRGIGSIPGHAVWTGISGLAIGWALSQNKGLANTVRGALGESAATSSAEQPEWSLFDRSTGQLVDSIGGDATILDAGRISFLPEQSREVNSPSGIPLPKSVPLAIGLAILGHSFWNGTSFLSQYLAESMGLGDVGIILVLLGWTAVLILGILAFGINIIRTVANAPGPEINQSKN